MRSCASACLVAALLFAGVACGGSSPQQQAAKEAQQSAAQGAQEMAKGFEAMAKGMKEMEAMSNEKPVDPVGFQLLEPLFPDFSGWEKGKPEGEKMTVPVAYSQSTVDYQKGDARINAKIADSGFNRMFMAPFLMFMTSGYSKETSTGYEKAVKFGDLPAWERWNSEGKNGELNILVAKRFLVTLDGNDIENTKVLHELAGKFDLGKLAGLK
jgi:hypothetical protein